MWLVPWLCCCNEACVQYYFYLAITQCKLVNGKAGLSTAQQPLVSAVWRCCLQASLHYCFDEPACWHFVTLTRLVMFAWHWHQLAPSVKQAAFTQCRCMYADLNQMWLVDTTAVYSLVNLVARLSNQLWCVGAMFACHQKLPWERHLAPAAMCTPLGCSCMKCCSAESPIMKKSWK